MRTLVLMRHAKSDWADSGLRDHDRPLNQRGEDAAPRMGRLLVEQKLRPDRILTSTAIRAKRTADLVAGSIGLADSEMTALEDLYLAPPSVLLDVAQRRGGDSDTLLVVAHNPGLEELVALLARRPEPVPTAAVAAFRLGIDAWSEVAIDMDAELIGVWRPKELD